MGRWMDKPRALPRACTFSGSSDPDHGPFYEFDRAIDNARTGRREAIYISKVSLESMLNAAESPFSPVDTSEVAKLKGEVNRLTKQLELAEGQIAAYESGDPAAHLDYEKLADLLADRLGKPAAPKIATPKGRGVSASAKKKSAKASKKAAE